MSTKPVGFTASELTFISAATRFAEKPNKYQGDTWIESEALRLQREHEDKLQANGLPVAHFVVLTSGPATGTPAHDTQAGQDAPDAPVVLVPASESRPAATWTLTKPKKFLNYSQQIYEFLREAPKDKSRPSAHDVVVAFSKNAPSGITNVVLTVGFDCAAKGGRKCSTDIRKIQKVITGMTAEKPHR